jgi:hypothetical protein
MFMKSRNFIPALIISLAATAFAACSGKGEKDEEKRISTEVVNNPATANETGESNKGVAVFTFETDNHEFGEIIQGERVTYAFKFKNTGDVPLVISSASASCGCTVPEYTKTPVEPGDEGFINVTFDSSGKSGMVSKTITLIANTVPSTKVLTISADIQVPKEKS